jgi:hypothetical protein
MNPHPHFLDRRPIDADAGQQRPDSRAEGFADMIAGKRAVLHDRHPPTEAGEGRRYRGAGRPAADDAHVDPAIDCTADHTIDAPAERAGHELEK